MNKVTIFKQACNKVEGFAAMGEHFMRQLVINGKSKSTHENYLRQMAKLALHYGKSPLDLESIELEEYLYFLVQKDTSGSQSAFSQRDGYAKAPGLWFTQAIPLVRQRCLTCRATTNPQFKGLTGSFVRRGGEVIAMCV